jgi:NTE family protein
MTIHLQGKQQRLALALSGGGFRAAAFHLGVFQKLLELELLWKIDLLSCVSGGSIAGAFLALNWKRDNALPRLEEYLTSRSIAVSTFLAGLVDPTESRVEKLADSYDEDLFNRANLTALAKGPRIYLNATNLSTGNLFFFVAGGGGPAEMGDHELGVVAAEDVRISSAVAASSAFPPVFNPLLLRTKEYEAKLDVKYVTLTDGGVYDNLGVNPLLRQRNAVDYAIVSDGGKPFALDEEPTESSLAVLKRSINILMEQVRGLQFDRLLQRHVAKVGPKPIWFSIDSQEGQANIGDPELASAVSTHLKKLSFGEMQLLTRHGSALVEARIRKYVPELLAG